MDAVAVVVSEIGILAVNGYRFSLEYRGVVAFPPGCSSTPKIFLATLETATSVEVHDIAAKCCSEFLAIDT